MERNQDSLTITGSVLWVAGYFGVMLLYTALDVEWQHFFRQKL